MCVRGVGGAEVGRLCACTFDCVGSGGGGVCEGGGGGRGREVVCMLVVTLYVC